MNPPRFAKYRACLFLSLISPTVPIVEAAATAPVVATTAGSVAGTGGEIQTFKGIPYAAPPVGPLRWRPPQPPVAWHGVRDASRFGDDCIQKPYVIPTGQKASEDCLT